jgi:hypothetical protein
MKRRHGKRSVQMKRLRFEANTHRLPKELENAQVDCAQLAKGESGFGYYGYHVLVSNRNNPDCVILSERRTQSDAQQNQADAGQKGQRRHPKPDKDDGT